jgi:hypothetical protein
MLSVVEKMRVIADEMESLAKVNERDPEAVHGDGDRLLVLSIETLAANLGDAAASRVINAYNDLTRWCA